MRYQAFSMVPTRAVMDQSLGHAAFRLLAVLASYRNSENGWCWPSTKTLALQLGYTEASGNTHVSKAIKELRDKGYIRHIAGAGRTVSRYQVILDQEDPGPQIGEDNVDAAPTLFDEAPTTKTVVSNTTANANQTILCNQTNEPEFAAQKKSARGSRLSEDWQPSAQDMQFAAILGLDGLRVQRRFVDFWLSKAGKDGVKLDWSATWRNWCRSAAERGQDMMPKNQGPRMHGGSL